MGRARVPGSASGDRGRGHGGKPRKASPGVRVIERDGYWYVSGTARAGGRSRRIRQSTGLPAGPDTRDAAEALRQQIEREFTAEVVHGIKPLPRVALAVAAAHYLSPAPGAVAPEKPAGPRTIEAVQAAELALGRAALCDIDADAWKRFLDVRLAGRVPATRQRFISALAPFLTFCLAQGWIRAMPEIERPKTPPRGRHKRRRRVAEVTPDLLVTVFDHASLHLRAQIYTEWTTGARVSSVLHGCRLCDVVLAEGREQITFHDTKNGDAVTASLHPVAAAVIRAYLAERGLLHRREWPLFLTPKLQPYSLRARESGSGGQNKAAWRGMIARATKTLRREAAKARQAGDRERAWLIWGKAALVRGMTQHWLRHWFATHALAGGMSPRSIMEQGGWRTMSSVLGYQHDVPEVRRRAVDALGIAPSLTQRPTMGGVSRSKK